MQNVKNKVKLLAILSILISSVSFGDIKLDGSKHQNTTIERTNSGNTIININTPNNQGVSVNHFNEFRAKDGVIFNNSDTKFGRSHLEGIIDGNSNLAKNQAANLILNKVAGTNRTEIENYLELVSKNKADMIFSSPNGVYLNGAKFIGFKNLTFTTSTVNLDDNGNVAPFQVTAGNITVGEKGLDATSIEKLAFLSATANINGEVRGNNIDVIAGNFNYNNTEQNHTGNSGGSISISNLGGIYGDQIRLITTNGYVGVQGDIIGEKIDLYGNLTNSQTGFIYADENIKFETINNHGVIITPTLEGINLNNTNYGDIETYKLLLSNTLGNYNGSSIRSDGDLLINAKIINNNFGFISGNNVTIDSLKLDVTNYNTSVSILANNNLNINSDYFRLNNYDPLKANNIYIRSNDFYNSGVINALRSLTIESNNIINYGTLRGRDVKMKYVNNFYQGNIQARNKYIEQVTELD